MVCVDIKRTIWIPVDNNSFSRCISYEINAMSSIIKIISCNTPHPRFWCVFIMVLIHTWLSKEHCHITYSQFCGRPQWQTDWLRTKVNSCELSSVEGLLYYPVSYLRFHFYHWVDNNIHLYFELWCSCYGMSS